MKKKKDEEKRKKRKYDKMKFCLLYTSDAADE